MIGCGLFLDVSACVNYIIVSSAEDSWEEIPGYQIEQSRDRYYVNQQLHTEMNSKEQLNKSLNN